MWKIYIIIIGVVLSFRLSVRCVSNSLNHPSHQFISTLSTDLEFLWHREHFKLSMVTIVWHIGKIYQFWCSFFLQVTSLLTKVCLSLCLSVRCVSLSLKHPSHQFISTLSTDLESLWYRKRFKLFMVTIVWHIWKIYQFPCSFFLQVTSLLTKVCLSVRLSVRCVSLSLKHPSHQFISTLSTDLESLWHGECFKLSLVTIDWQIWKI